MSPDIEPRDGGDFALGAAGAPAPRPADVIGTPDAGLVRINDGRFAPCGMGFLVTPRLVVTCGHVINVALDRPIRATDPIPSSATVTVTFPLADDETVGDPPRVEVAHRHATVLRFVPPGRRPDDDIALLMLDRPAPAEVGVCVLADITGAPLEYDELGIYGAPSGTQVPIHFAARLAGKANQAWVQIDGTDGQRTFAEGGFSGGRVWDHTHDVAIGMLAAVHMNDQLRRAFMIPARTIARVLPEVPVERRPLGRLFCRNWTIFVLVAFLGLMAHFLANRINNFPEMLSLGFGNPVVAAFWGSILGAIFLPVSFHLLLRFAFAYRWHPWWMRVPGFGHWSAPADPTRSRTTAILVLVIFAVIPTYLQLHFINMVHQDAKVYVYGGSPLGYSTEDFKKMGALCDERTVHLCTHSNFGLFSLVPPKDEAAAKRPISDIYLKNVYHIGDRELPKSGSVTFFPILEPLLILFGTIWGLVLAAYYIVVLRAPTAIEPPRASLID